MGDTCGLEGARGVGVLAEPVVVEDIVDGYPPAGILHEALWGIGCPRVTRLMCVINYAILKTLILHAISKDYTQTLQITAAPSNQTFLWEKNIHTECLHSRFVLSAKSSKLHHLKMIEQNGQMTAQSCSTAAC